MPATMIRHRHTQAKGEPASHHPLRREIKFLGFELGRTIRRCGGEGLYTLVERIRTLAKARRAGDAQADAELQAQIEALSHDDTAGVIRAFSCFFDLANIAEDRQRVRVLRQREQASAPDPRPESIAAAIETLHAQGMSAAELQRLLNRLDVEMVFTAHPTEAKRRTIRRTLRRLRDHLSTLDTDDILPRERERVLRYIRADIAALWHTDPLRPQRPTVMGEVRRSLFLLDSLWDVTPRLCRDMRDGLARTYGGDVKEKQFLRFGTWIGGDRDGNPYVTPEVTEQTLSLLRERTVDRHIAFTKHMLNILSVSSEHDSPQQLLDAITQARDAWPEVGERIDALHPQELFRHWLAVIDFRLHATRATTPWESDVDRAGGAYLDASELEGDLTLMRESLLAMNLDDLADSELQEWIDRVRVFGFQFARLDIREHAGVLRKAVGEITAGLGLAEAYEQLDEAEKIQVLTAPPPASQLESLDVTALTDPSRRTLELFQLLDRLATTRAGWHAIGGFVISMTSAPSDVLAVLWLSRVAAALHGRKGDASLQIAPLFETIDDLQRADELLDQLLSNPVYHEHVTAGGGCQMCMVGYSDSAKDGGYLAANWALNEAQRKLAKTARRHEVDLMVFHGRGGALGRGGGPAARSILGLPPDAVAGKLRMTEQGEVLAERYDDPAIAHRHLEQVIAATLRVSARSAHEPEAEWTAIMNDAAAQSCAAYRRLIQRDDFVHYFETASPIAGIEMLTIASRPARRSGRRDVADLRAIPFTFAWTQNRHLINAFYGLGEALASANRDHPHALRAMYQNWPWFQGLIDNAALALAKSDLGIAARYASLADENAEGDTVFNDVRTEYGASHDVILAVTGESRLLAAAPWLEASIATRNPYVDPLNFIQIQLLSRLSKQPTDAALEHLNDMLRHSIHGVAAGMRTTG